MYKVQPVNNSCLNLLLKKPLAETFNYKFPPDAVQVNFTGLNKCLEFIFNVKLIKKLKRHMEVIINLKMLRACTMQFVYICLLKDKEYCYIVKG